MAKSPASRTASLAQPSADHGPFFANPNEPRGIRNNNPGNLEMVRNPDRAMMHDYQFGRMGSDGRFAVYSTPAGGIAANYETLRNYQERGLNTIAKIVNTWAPPFENNTKAYIAAVSMATGIPPNAPLPSLYARPDVAASILSAKYEVENGKNPYTKDVINKGIDVARNALTANYTKMDTPTELRVMEENMRSQREVFRGPSDYGPPVWDGTSSPEPTLAAPVGAVSMSDIPSIAPDMSAGLESANAGYSEPVGSFGGPLADRAAPMDTYSTGGSFGGEVAAPDYTAAFSGSPLGPAQSFGGFTPSFSETSAFTPDTYTTGGSFGVDPANYGASVETANAGYSAPEAAITGFEATAALGSPMNDTLKSDIPSYERGAMATPWGYAGTPAFSEALSVIGPQGMKADIAPTTGAVFGQEIGRALSNNAFYSPGFAPQSIAPWSDPAPAPEVQPEQPAKPNTAVAVTPPEYPLTVPAFAPLPELPAPINIAPTPSVARPAPSRPAAPKTIERPAPPRDFRPAETAQPQRTERVGLERYDTPSGFLGSVLGGDRAAVGDLSRMTGTDYSGLAQRAMGDDQYAQPAMLGLGNAWAEATGQQGFKGLFDGWGGWSSPTSGGWFTGENVGRGVGAVAGGALGGIPGAFAGGWLGGIAGDAISPTNNWGTGGLYDPGPNGGTGGLYDPRGPQDRGIFDGLFGGFGWGGGGGDSYGGTPGSGGLY